MKFEIKNRFTLSVIFECEAESLRAAVELAVEKKVSLHGAYLGGADLGGADLRDADLRDADLHGAYLGGADLGGADLRDADLGGADLHGAYLGGAYLGGADLGGADLRDADLRDADLHGAYLGGADLGGADLRDADLRDADLHGAYLGGAKDDFLSKLTKQKSEAGHLYKSLIDGKVDGSCYEGECCCFVGTLANAKGVDYCSLEIKPDSSSPVERLFYAIKKGDTPDNNPISAIVVEWMKEWASTEGVRLPERKVVWE